jgi:ribose 5-phosphate isomerase B
MRSYICANRIVMSITANKTPRIMSPLCDNIYSAERAKKRYNDNVLTLVRHTVGPELAKKLVEVWLKREFQGNGSKKIEKNTGI